MSRLETTSDIRTPFYFGVEAFERVSRYDLLAVCFGKGHEHQQVVLGFVDNRSKFEESIANVIGNHATQSVRGFGRFVSEDGIDKREYHLPLFLSNVRNHVAQEMYLASLSCRFKQFGTRGFPTNVRIRNRQTRTT